MPVAGLRAAALPAGERIPALGQGPWYFAEDARRRHDEITALCLGPDLGMMTARGRVKRA